MVSVSFQNNVKVYQTSGTKKFQTAPFSVQKNSQNISQPAFRANEYNTVLTIRYNEKAAEYINAKKPNIIGIIQVIILVV